MQLMRRVVAPVARRATAPLRGVAHRARKARGSERALQRAGSYVADSRTCKNDIQWITPSALSASTPRKPSVPPSCGSSHRPPSAWGLVEPAVAVRDGDVLHQLHRTKAERCRRASLDHTGQYRLSRTQARQHRRTECRGAFDGSRAGAGHARDGSSRRGRQAIGAGIGRQRTSSSVTPISGPIQFSAPYDRSVPTKTPVAPPTASESCASMRRFSYVGPGSAGMIGW